jgi:DNA-binding transcriptional LysR family regulator
LVLVSDILTVRYQPTSNVDLAWREADLALRASNQPPEHLYGREVGELRYAVFAHRRFFKGSKTPALEDLPLVGFDESIRRLDIARWPQARLPGTRARLRSDSLIAMMQAAAAGIGVAALPLFAADHGGAAAAAGRPGDHRRRAEAVTGSGKFIVSLCSTGAVLRHANASAEITRRYDDPVQWLCRHRPCE